MASGVKQQCVASTRVGIGSFKRARRVSKRLKEREGEPGTRRCAVWGRFGGGKERGGSGGRSEAGRQTRPPHPASNQSRTLVILVLIRIIVVVPAVLATIIPAQKEPWPINILFTTIHYYSPTELATNTTRISKVGLYVLRISKDKDGPRVFYLPTDIPGFRWECCFLIERFMKGGCLALSFILCFFDLERQLTDEREFQPAIC